MTSNVQRFLKIVKHPLKFRIFLLSKLPAAYFSGIKIIDIDERRCRVSVPFQWLTQNPFKSTYFASLAMAAELSTGALAMMHVYKTKPDVSMLLTNINANYFKKVIGTAIFTCEDGHAIRDVIEEGRAQAEARQVTVKSTGTDHQGNVVAEFFFTWSFKTKKR